jgi:hypothetical protein
MKSISVHENFPLWTVIISNLVSVLTYRFGFIIIYRTGLVFSILYLVYILILEYRLIRWAGSLHPQYRDPGIFE